MQKQPSPQSYFRYSNQTPEQLMIRKVEQITSMVDKITIDKELKITQNLNSHQKVFNYRNQFSNSPQIESKILYFNSPVNPNKPLSHSTSNQVFISSNAHTNDTLSSFAKYHNLSYQQTNNANSRQNSQGNKNQRKKFISLTQKCKTECSEDNKNDKNEIIIMKKQQQNRKSFIKTIQFGKTNSIENCEKRYSNQTIISLNNNSNSKIKTRLKSFSSYEPNNLNEKINENNINKIKEDETMIMSESILFSESKQFVSSNLAMKNRSQIMKKLMLKSEKTDKVKQYDKNLRTLTRQDSPILNLMDLLQLQKQKSARSIRQRENSFQLLNTSIQQYYSAVKQFNLLEQEIKQQSDVVDEEQLNLIKNKLISSQNHHYINIKNNLDNSNLNNNFENYSQNHQYHHQNDNNTDQILQNFTKPIPSNHANVSHKKIKFISLLQKRNNQRYKIKNQQHNLNHLGHLDGNDIQKKYSYKK